MNIVIIFILIGIAHWAQHVMTCKGCKKHLWDFNTFILHGIVSSFGWPMHLMSYLGRMFLFRSFRDDPSIVPIMEPEEIVQDENESDEDFEKRIQDVISKHIAADMNKKRKMK